MADNGNDQSSSSDDDTSNSEEGNDTECSHEELERCVKVPLPENIAAYLEKRELVRDENIVSCDNNLGEKVIKNYIIARNILQHLPWQQKLLCKHVCSTWRSAVQVLQREQLSPCDFVVDFQDDWLKKSSPLVTEPLVVFTFANCKALYHATHCTTAKDCTAIIYSLSTSAYEGRNIRAPGQQNLNSILRCTQLCEQRHSSIDLVQNSVCAPKQCMMTVKAAYLSYLPLQHSPTYPQSILYRMFRRRSDPYMNGIYIPVIPNVEFHVINIKSNTNMPRDFYSEVDRISRDRIIQGILVFVTETFLLHSAEEFDCLHYFKTVQPSIPYALGGCIVEDTMYGDNDINNIIDGVNNGTEFISENLISIGMFTVPKNAPDTEQGDKYNFNMYSLVIDSSENTKPKIQSSITEFSNKVPRFEHSIVFKLSCLGRDQRHEVEQKYFRDAFPTTRLIGCYGNGELGINHPARPPAEPRPRATKRPRRVAEPKLDSIMYSYSTIFVYMGWGKITSMCGPVQK